MRYTPLLDQGISKVQFMAREFNGGFVGGVEP
jgi:hypothetical protein